MFTYMLAPWIRHGIGKNCGGGPGVVRLQVWPGVSQLDLGAADLRIFSSPDAMAIGKQVGAVGPVGPGTSRTGDRS